MYILAVCNKIISNIVKGVIKIKNIVLKILTEYLLIFPEEKEKQSQFIEFLEKNNDDQITDWNNFDGHIVASGFVYAKKERKFLVLYHKDMKMFVYPGGHTDRTDKNPLEAAIREVKEETGLKKFEEVKVSENELVPIDIDVHKVEYNTRLDLPEHYHFDMRYLFIIDKVEQIKIDKEESSEYKWISEEELIRQNKRAKRALKKIDCILKKLNK